jgi:hypothetical protein
MVIETDFNCLFMPALVANERAAKKVIAVGDRDRKQSRHDASL